MKSFNEYYKLLILAVILAVVSFFSIFIGSANVSFAEVFSIFNEHLSQGSFIIIKLRIPRIILAIIAGGILSVSGLVYQTVLKNSLAEPFLMGVSSGASFGVALSVLLSDMFLKFQLPYFPFAFGGSLLTIFIIFVVSSTGKSALYNLIFIGLSISFLFNAGLTLIFSLLGNRSSDIILWLFGSLAKPFDYKTLTVITIIFILFIIVLLFSSKLLDIMYLPDDTITTSGVNVKATRLLFFVFTSMYTALIVSLCGIIGFVGLIVPHITRNFFPGRHKFLIPASALIGGILLLFSDTIARTFISLVSDYGRELPIGVITSLIGAPFFIYLLSSRKEH
ncbi:MAG: hypothetical protein A2015_10290 [Spirochaetes bacterium GWF1_31_7]|nr:MAG: hypothetical protein A2Y30_05925 [Spirochaetes bacterium GWE1_32_154]OHD49524.1 MAG: hypothetical protein A2Y29_01985 [Spirochaetes bacterium GWE2_31_10]OHD49717.1 MAG: hypothetical protein A2015_10290 [Spirochaetes bacterium GWF1_31_7]OHD77303.1 MAG: hypothetical protein A2355_13885 [Spirochaetes bacterium RIFOXYB1_FULL_32_8]HBD95686.1 hypothetical protein [Spirochaetia bacterium]